MLITYLQAPSLKALIQGIPGMEFAFLPGTDGQADVLLITQLGFAVAAWKMP